MDCASGPTATSINQLLTHYPIISADPGAKITP